MINNKAELTTQQIVTMIILIASFAILLLFYFNLNLGDASKKDICHDSVIKQGSLAKNAFKGGSLDCRTEYVCISGGEDCEDFGADTTIEIDAKNESEFYRAVAEEMANCWWMFGEGKIDYSGANFLGSGSYCSICSVLAFDEEIKKNIESNGVFIYDDFLKYLDENKMQGSSKTYLNYLTSHGEKYKELYSGKVINFNEEMVILTAINNDGPLFFKRKPDDVSFAIPPMFLIKDKTTYNNDPFNCKNYVTMA